MKKPRKLFIKENLVTIVLILLVSAITYLPLVDKFGIYRDAWQVIRTALSMGVDKIPGLFTIDRPLAGWIFLLGYQLQGDNVLAWSLVTFSLHLIAVLCLWWILRMLWPRERIATTLMALLFAVYPGFLEMPDAITYQIHISVLAAAMLSIALTLKAYQVENSFQKIFLISISVLLALGYLFTVEYYIGLEVFRFILLWYMQNRAGKPGNFIRKTSKTFFRFFPYFIVGILFLIWRLFFFKGSRPTTNINLLTQKYLASPLTMLFKVGSNWLTDFFNTVVGGWVVPAYNLSTQTGTRDLVVSIFLGVLATGLTVFYLAWDRRFSETNKAGDDLYIPQDWSRDAIWIGLLSVLVIALPTSLANRAISFQATLTNGLDRYTLLPALGAVVLVVGLLYRFNSEKLRWALVLMLLGSSVMAQYQNAVLFRDDWSSTRSLFWQLSWRAPQLQSGTVLLTAVPTASTVSESYHIGYPASLIYYPSVERPAIASQVLESGTIDDILMQIKDTESRRTVTFDRDYRKSLVAYIPTENSCLHIVDGQNPILPSGTSPWVQIIAPYSHLEQILVDASPMVPPASLFGNEPSRGWCYYYQKASLAAQQGNWAEVVRFGEEAKQLNLAPGDNSEWWPFIEGYLYMGDYDRAGEYLAIIKESSYLRHQLCASLSKPQSALDADMPESPRTYLMDSLCN